MTVSPIRIVLALMVWLLLMAVVTVFHFSRWLETDHRVEEVHRQYIVEKGATLTSVGWDLHKKGLVRWPRVWRYYAQYFSKTPIKAGEYHLSYRESPLSLLQRFQKGEVITYTITFSEGLNFREFLALLFKEEKLENTLEGKSFEEIVALLGLDIEHPEGWFFPDTYQFVRGDTDASILLRAHQKMQQELDFLWRGREPKLPYANAYEALIMASIIEKETGVPDERQMIAGVFVRRLEKRMRLQTDPTVIYGMGDKYQGNITKKDLKTPTPYNTYTIKGLPPTPIAMPGRDAIYAALHPTPGDSLYFVAKGDGSHQFSATLDEHLDAVRQYQLKRKKNYQSSPPLQR